jgi:hypothetical protein
MSGDGILEIDGVLIDAGRVVYVEHDDENCNNLSVTLDGMEDEVIIHDCTISRFRNEWARSKKY